MTVRAWITISVLVLLALAAAVTIRVLSPIPAPALFASAGRTRIEGVFRGSCWTQGGGKLHCRQGERGARSGPAVPASGTLRVLAAYPVQPERGTLRITSSSGRVVHEGTWSDRVAYSLDRGSYILAADARYGGRAYVRYDFPFVVR